MNLLKVGARGLVVALVGVLVACGGSSSNSGSTTVPVYINTSSLPNGAENAAYNAVIQAAGGTSPYTFSIIGGALPPGLSINSSNGVITGTPTAAGRFTFTVQATDSKSVSGSLKLGIYVEGVVIVQAMTLASGSLGVSYLNPDGSPVTLAATGGIAPYHWSITSSGTLPPGLGLDPNSGVITGIPTANGIYTFTVQATDSETTPASGTATMSIDIFSITTASLPDGLVYQPYNQSLAVGGGKRPYTWSISSGSLPPGLSINTSNGAISGIPTQTGAFPFTVKVVDSSTPSASATASLSINIAPEVTNSALNGAYVFTFSGYNQNGSLVLMAGSFNADGNGNITGGFLDLNNGTGEPDDKSNVPIPQTIQASVYSIGANGLGTMTIVTKDQSGNPHTFNFHLAITSSCAVSGPGNTCGSLIEDYDPTAPTAYGSGQLKVQTAGVTIAQLQGSFATGQFGADPQGARFAAAGFYKQVNDQGDLGNGVLDVNDAGTLTPSVPWSGTLVNQFSSNPNCAFGRCGANLTFNQQKPFYIYAYYIVSSNEVVFLFTDPVTKGSFANLTLWSSLRQLTSVTGLDNTILKGTSAFETTAKDTNGTADVTAGLFAGQGVAGHTCQSGNSDPATLNFDENQGGTVLTQQSQQGTYCVDPTTGRITLTGFGAEPPIFYMVAANKAFVVGTDATVTSGLLEPQTGAPFLNGSIVGPYAGGTTTPATPTVTDAASWFLSDGSGDINGNSNTSGSGGTGQTNFTGTYSVDSTGRSVLTENGSPAAIMYVVSPTKVVMLPYGNDPALSTFGSVTNSNN